VVPESIGMDIAGGHLPVVATSQKSNPKEQILNLGINASITEAHEEPTRNDEMVSEQFKFNRLSKDNECRMDGGEKLLVLSAEVDNQRYDVGTCLASNVNPPPQWPSPQTLWAPTWKPIFGLITGGWIMVGQIQ
ncbi:hypothetical protein Ancab_010641, partial [Ancistrocladus abbreviatus]